MNEHHFNQSRLAEVMTYDQACTMEQMYTAHTIAQAPNYPKQYIKPLLRRYANTKTRANLVTRLIVDYMTWQPNCNARRVNTMGLPMIDKRTKRVTGWRPSGEVPGTPDIIGSVNGRLINIEVKDKDQQSEVQRRYQQRAETAGELYWLVRSFDEFYKHMQEL